MRTFFALTISAVMAAAVAQASTVVLADMDDLIAASTTGLGAGVTHDTTMTGSVYHFDGSGAILNINSSALSDAVSGGQGIMTVAAWVKQSARTDNMIFSTGGQADGFMFGINNGGFKFTTKNVADNEPGLSVNSDEWVLVAVGINLTETGNSRYYKSSTNGQFYSREFGAWNDPNPLTFAIGSGNSDNLRDGFVGSIANLTVIKSDGLLNNSDISALVGEMPTSVPEPSTAMLSLLGMAGLVARRRRN